MSFTSRVIHRQDKSRLVKTVCDFTDKKKLTFSSGDYFLLAFSQKGEPITIETPVDFKHFGCGVLISGEDRFSLKSESEEILEIFFSGQDAVLLEQFLKTDITSCSARGAARLTNRELSGLWEKAKKVIRAPTEAERDFMGRELLFGIVLKYFCGSSIPEKQEQSIPEWLLNTVEQMKEPTSFTKGISQMLQICQKTPEHLSRCMKQHYGVTPTQFINSLRMKNAARLLIETNESVMDICFENGYQNISWFNSLFKETFSVSPSEYRAQFRGK